MPTKGLERLTQHVLSNSKEARQIDLAYANEKGKAGRPYRAKHYYRQTPALIGSALSRKSSPVAATSYALLKQQC